MWYGSEESYYGLLRASDADVYGCMYVYIYTLYTTKEMWRDFVSFESQCSGI